MNARPLIVLLVAAAMFGAPTTTHAAAPDSVQRLQLRRITGEGLIGFATKFFYKRYPTAFNWSFKSRFRSEENWTKVVREQTYFAEVGLGGDNSPVLLLVVDNPNWCDSEGCLATIFRRSATGYTLICEAALPEPESDATEAEILPKIENGYHQIATATRIIQWNAEPDSTGILCTAENRAP
jgi:hypothetical protein